MTFLITELSLLFVTVYLANDYPYYRVIHAICNWVKIILATEQKKTDFKPEDDSALALMGTTVSSVCSICLIQREVISIHFVN